MSTSKVMESRAKQSSSREQQQQQQQQQQPIYYQYQQPIYKPDVVAIQVHRNRSSEDIRIGQGPLAAPLDAVTSLTATNGGHQTFYKPSWRQRSYEDGDITPVSEHPPYGQIVPGGGTLPRPRNGKSRPVASICASSASDVDGGSTAAPQLRYGTLTKKNPPPTPPKRMSSGGVEDESIYGRHVKSSPLPLPPPPPPIDSGLSLLAYSDDSEDFPPPPAPITASDSYLQHGQASAAASVRERLDNILQRSGAGHWPRQHPSHPSHPAHPNPSQPLYAPANNHTTSRQR